MFSRFAVIVFLSSLLIGCGSTNQRGEIQTSAAPQLSSTEGATLAFTRDDSLLYFAVGARVFVNGQQVAKLARKESFSMISPAGQIEIIVDSWSAPGKFRINIIGEREKVYKFKISPNTSGFIAGVSFGLIGSLLEDGGSFKLELIE